MIHIVILIFQVHFAAGGSYLDCLLTPYGTSNGKAVLVGISIVCFWKCDYNVFSFYALFICSLFHLIAVAVRWVFPYNIRNVKHSYTLGVESEADTGGYVQPSQKNWTSYGFWRAKRASWYLNSFMLERIEGAILFIFAWWFLMMNKLSSIIFDFFELFFSRHDMRSFANVSFDWNSPELDIEIPECHESRLRMVRHRGVLY